MKRPSRRSARADHGAALLELTLALPILILLVLGIISFGLVLSFKQEMTQLAAEAARAGVTAGQTGAVPAAQAVYTTSAPSLLDRACGTRGLTCTATTVGCASGDCRIEVTVTFDNAHHPLAPPVPFISAFLPATMRASSVGRISGT